MNLRIIGISTSFCIVLVIFPIVANGQGNLIQNGNFQTGDLSDWTVFTTINGTLGSTFGLPNVVSFDVTGSGTPTNAAQFQAGEATGFGRTPLGGGIYQIFNCPAGQYAISVDLAAFDDNYNGLENGDAGQFTLLVDGTAITNVQLGEIFSGQTLRGSLEATVPLNQGSNEIAIEIIRVGNNGDYYGVTPLQYLDNIYVEAVPEPSVLGLSSICTLFLCWHLKWSNSARVCAKQLFRIITAYSRRPNASC
jgi:hypothetical protein